MSNLLSVDGKKLNKILGKSDFEVIGIEGSHHFIRHADGRSSVIPDHSRENTGIDLFHKILKDCELSVENFKSLMTK